MFLFSVLFVLFSSSSFAYSDHDLEKLSHSQKWMKLLHYKPTLFGGVKSEADGPKFFIHPDGKHDAFKEIKAAAESFGSEKNPGNDHQICKFPLRYKWLNKELGMPWSADFSGCTNYISFFSKLAAKRASIVFSSYYLSNPNSAFGHTFMRLSRYDDKNETEMLDYGINYSAQSTSTNPFSYAVMGLFGGFKGRFAAIPFYYKVREYSNSEFRDLWSYDLNLSMGQVLEMVDHIWELGDTWFDYFYFQENCSYHLLSVIDVAAPEKNMTSHYPLFTIPADTIRGLRKAGLISEGKRRESTYSKLVRLSEKLTHESLEKAKKISQHPQDSKKLVTGLGPQKAADILDVAIEAFDYNNAQEVLTDDPKVKKQKEFILVERAINPVITPDDPSFSKDQSESPALTHAPTRFGFAGGYENKRGNYSKLEVRTSFHDLLDPPRGSMKNAQLEMGKISFKYIENKYQDPKFVLDHFSVVSLRNFQGQNFWASPRSIEVDVGVSSIRQAACFDCPAAYVMGSIGNSINVLSDKLLLAMLFNGEANWQNFYQDGYRLGVGPKIYSRFKFSDKFLTAFEALYHWNSYRPNEAFKDHQTVLDWEWRYHFNEAISMAWKNGSIERNSQWMTRTELGLQYFY